MINSHWLIAIALASAQAEAPLEAEPETSVKAVDLGRSSDGADPPAGELTATQAEALRTKCGTRRFDTSAEGMIDGQMKRRRMTLCAAPGDSDAQWAKKLENAVVWVRLQEDLADDVKNQLIADLRVKIDEVRSLAAAQPEPPVARAIAPPVVARPAQTPLQPASQPPLTVLCASPGGPRAPCNTLASDTILVFRSDGQSVNGAKLRFLRRGEYNRGEVALPSVLRPGQEARVKLPARLCQGVLQSTVTIQVLTRDPAAASGERAGQSLGPFDLRC